MSRFRGLEGARQERKTGKAVIRHARARGEGGEEERTHALGVARALVKDWRLGQVPTN